MKNELYVGQKFRDKNGGALYMIACIEGNHTLICIGNSDYVGCSYSGLKGGAIEEVFAGNQKFFTEVK